MNQDIQPIDERDISESLFFIDKEWCVKGAFTVKSQLAEDRLWKRIDHGNIEKIQVKKRVQPIVESTSGSMA